MCFEIDSEPPIDPILAAQTTSKRITLTSKDGTEFAAWSARSEQPSQAGIVVLPDVRGLFNFYEQLANRFAEENINAVAIDYFGRTAGNSDRNADFAFQDHVAQTKYNQISDDVAAAVAYLRSPEGGSCGSIFTVGFCFGGSNSWNQAANGHGLSGVIGFYGRPGLGRDGSPGPKERVTQMECPVLALMGGADAGIPQSDVDEFEAALRAAGVRHEIVVYPGAPHSFFDRSYEQHASASADSWRRCLDFIRTNMKPSATINA